LVEAVMASAIIGEAFVFFAFFKDATGTALVVPDATIEVFRFDENGNKVSLVAAGTAMLTVPAITGQYIHCHTTSGSLPRGATLYGIMQGTDGGSGDTLVVQQEVSMLSPTDFGPGLNAGFV
jgi:hypothetical protein